MISEKKLKRLALDDPSRKIRKNATSKIKDENVLFAIAKTENDEEIIIEAIKNIQNEEYLMELGLKYENRKIISEIIPKINDVSNLKELLRKNRMTDVGDIIYQIHKVSPNDNIKITDFKTPVQRIGFIKILNDKKFENFLKQKDIVKNFDDYEWLCEKFPKMVGIVKNDILKRTNNQRFLIECVENEKMDCNTSLVLSRIKDESKLLELFHTLEEAYVPDILSNPNFKYESIIIDYLYSPELIQRLDKLSYVAGNSSFKNQYALFDLLIRQSVSSKLIDKIDDKFMLEDIARFNKDVANNIEDESVLLDLALDDHEIALERLGKETKLLYELIGD